jgi:alcohol dehydrogenase (NADP+)
MRFAIVGCGFIAQQYAEAAAAHDALDLVATTDLVPERAQHLADAFGGTAYADLDALLAGSDAECIVNLTLHDAHAPVTRQCLEAGRHVFSEKPLALNVKNARSLVELADANDVRLGCAPISLLAGAQHLAGRYLREGRCGTLRMIYATCNLGRLTEWNENPEPFLRIGPLFDGAVYPLTVLTGLLGPVRRVLMAHQSLLLDAHTHDGATFSVDTPDHTMAVLEFEGGVQAQLTASMYVPYQTTHFNSLEFHGDDGSLFLRNCGALNASDPEAVQFARLGKPYRPVPLPQPATPHTYASALTDMAEAIRDGRPPLASGRQAAHVVSIIHAIEQCANSRHPVPVDDVGFSSPPLTDQSVLQSASPASLPAIGFGCSRYRGGNTYVDLEDAIVDALDMGVRLLDGAELYGTEPLIGDILQRPGSPPRDAVYLISKVWNTNHTPEHLTDACRASRNALGVETLDCYMLHWPDAWVHTDPLAGIEKLSHEAAMARTFPTDDDGNPREADIDLETTWRAMEALVDRGWTRHLGVSNFERDDLERLLALADVPPAIHQIACHPYAPRTALVDVCHVRDICVMAHSPLSTEGLLDDPALQSIANRHGVSTAQIVLRWLIQRGIVPIPSSTSRAHIAENLDVFQFTLSNDEMQLIGTLRRSSASP